MCLVPWSAIAPLNQGDYNGRITLVENGERFLTPNACAGCLLTGWKAAVGRAERIRASADLPDQAALHPVIRRPAQTSGVRKRLPFSLCINDSTSDLHERRGESFRCPYPQSRSSWARPYWEGNSRKGTSRAIAACTLPSHKSSRTLTGWCLGSISKEARGWIVTSHEFLRVSSLLFFTKPYQRGLLSSGARSSDLYPVM